MTTRHHLPVLQPAPELADAYRAPRPRTRAECIDGPRPCPWVSCRHHLALDVHEVEGTRDRPPTLRLNGRSVAGLRQGASAAVVAMFVEATLERLASMRASCALDVADQGRQKVRVVAEHLGVTRKRLVAEVALARPRMRQALEAVSITRDAVQTSGGPASGHRSKGGNDA